MYQTRCPSCDVEDELIVVGGVFHATGLPLSADGFEFSDADKVSTEEETVCCKACGRFFSLADLHRDAPPGEPGTRFKIKG